MRQHLYKAMLITLALGSIPLSGFAQSNGNVIPPSDQQTTLGVRAQTSTCSPLDWQIAQDAIAWWSDFAPQAGKVKSDDARQKLRDYKTTLDASILNGKKAYIQFATKIAPEDRYIPPEVRKKFDWTQCPDDADVRFMVLAKIWNDDPTTGKTILIPGLSYSVIVLDNHNHVAYVTARHVTAPTLQRAWRGEDGSIFSVWSDECKEPLFQSLDLTYKDLEKKLK